MITECCTDYWVRVKVLEPSCCKKWQKSPCQETGVGNSGPRTTEDTEWCQIDPKLFGIIQKLQTSPLLNQTSILTETFFATSYSKETLTELHACVSFR